MTKGPLFPQMIAFTIPFVLANLLQTMYTIADLAIVGHFAPTGDLAAVSISGQITMFMTLIGISIANGGQIYTAQLMGQGRKKDLNSAVGTSLCFSLILAVTVTVLCLILARPILRSLNTPSGSVASAERYLMTCGSGMIFVFGYNAVCAILRGMGESKAPTVFIAVCAVMNVLGDLILVMGLGLGAIGAAAATVASQFTSFLLALFFLYRRRAEAGFDFRPASFRPHRAPLRVIVRLSLPLVVMQLAINLSMLFVNAHINRFGVAAASVAGIGGKLYSIVTIVSSAFSAAMATIVGQNIGAGQIDRIRRAMHIALAINLMFFALIAAVCLLFPRFVFGVFTSDESIIDLAPHYFTIAIWAYLCFALMHPTIGLINGVGNTFYNLLVGVLDGVVARIGLSLLLGERMGMWGFFWGYSLAGSISVLMGWIYYLSGRWKKRRLL